MKKEVITCFACAVFCHLALLFGFHVGTTARPLPAGEEISPVDLNLVAAAPDPAAEQTPAPTAAPTPESNPMPTPEPSAIPTPEPLPPEPASPIEAPRQAPHPSTTAIAKPPRPSAVAARSNNAAIRPGPAIAARPRYRSNPPPEYPVEARRLHQEGVALLGVEVSAEGRPASVHIKRSSGVPILDQAALDAVRQWAFEPARIGILPVASFVDVPVRFSLTQ